MEIDYQIYPTQEDFLKKNYKKYLIEISTNFINNYDQNESEDLGQRIKSLFTFCSNMLKCTMETFKSLEEMKRCEMISLILQDYFLVDITDSKKSSVKKITIQSKMKNSTRDVDANKKFKDFMLNTFDRISFAIIQAFIRLWLISLYKDIKKNCTKQEARMMKQKLFISQIKKEVQIEVDRIRMLEKLKGVEENTITMIINTITLHNTNIFFIRFLQKFGDKMEFDEEIINDLKNKESLIKQNQLKKQQSSRQIKQFYRKSKTDKKINQDNILDHLRKPKTTNKYQNKKDGFPFSSKKKPYKVNQKNLENVLSKRFSNGARRNRRSICRNSNTGLQFTYSAKYIQTHQRKDKAEDFTIFDKEGDLLSPSAFDENEFLDQFKEREKEFKEIDKLESYFGNNDMSQISNVTYGKSFLVAETPKKEMGNNVLRSSLMKERRMLFFKK